MIGEWSGKTRSTPIPPEILRTVKVSRDPPPRRAITTPANIWMRSFSPSRTLTWTRIESPGANGGMPVFSDGFSSSRSRSVIASPCRREDPRGSPKNGAFYRRDRPPFKRRRSASALPFSRLGRPFFEQIRAPLARPLERSRCAPARDAGVVAGQQRLRHRQAAKLTRAGVVRVVEAVIQEGFVLERLGGA